VACLRQRSGSDYTLVVYWGGEKHSKALRTTDPAEAARIKLDVEEQRRRIRNKEAPKATQLLDEGFSIVDVLFGCAPVYQCRATYSTFSTVVSDF